MTRSCVCIYFQVFHASSIPLLVVNLSRGTTLKAIAKSKYQEDAFPANHTSVWGSYFDRRSMRWGFACCHSLTLKAYCTGEDGRAANDEANSVLNIDVEAQRKMLEPRVAGEKSKVFWKRGERRVCRAFSRALCLGARNGLYARGTC